MYKSKMQQIVLLSGLMAAGSANSADFGMYATAGTIGLGGGVVANFGSHLGARLGYTGFTYDIDDLEKSDMTFDGDAKLGGVQALLDWYPFGGGFRVTAGAVENARVSVLAVPTGGTFTFDGVEYSASDVGAARGKAEFRSIALYLGVGFGRALTTDGHFSFTADLGVAFTGSPDFTLSVTCNANDPTLCANLAADAAAEEQQLQEDAKDYKYWPVLSIGVSYKF
jgi:hypothetical protein